MHHFFRVYAHVYNFCSQGFIVYATLNGWCSLPFSLGPVPIDVSVMFMSICVLYCHCSYANVSKYVCNATLMCAMHVQYSFFRVNTVCAFLFYYRLRFIFIGFTLWSESMFCIVTEKLHNKHRYIWQILHKVGWVTTRILKIRKCMRKKERKCAKNGEHFNTNDMLKLETKNFMTQCICSTTYQWCTMHMWLNVCCDEAQKQTFFAHTHTSVNKQWISKMYNITIEESEKYTTKKKKKYKN